MPVLGFQDLVLAQNFEPDPMVIAIIFWNPTFVSKSAGSFLQFYAHFFKHIFLHERASEKRWGAGKRSKCAEFRCGPFQHSGLAWGPRFFFYFPTWPPFKRGQSLDPVHEALDRPAACYAKSRLSARLLAWSEECPTPRWGMGFQAMAIHYILSIKFREI